jgi:hypothetical protein
MGTLLLATLVILKISRGVSQLYLKTSYLASFRTTLDKFQYVNRGKREFGPAFEKSLELA